MRLGYPVAGATLAALLLATGCAGHTELLRSTDQPSQQDSTTVRKSLSTRPLPPPAVPRPVRESLLTDREVAGEGVRQVRAGASVPAVQGRLPDCLRGVLRAAEPAVGQRAAAWRYPTGSVLAQYVAGYPAPRLDRMLREAGSCGSPLPVPGADRGGQVRWCEPNQPGTVSCSVLLGGAQQASLVTVRSQQRQRAVEAVRRLAPLAAAKLD